MATVGRGADQYTVRFPDGLRDRVKNAAALTGRSMNDLIVAALEEKYPATDFDYFDLGEFLDRVNSARSRQEKDDLLRVLQDFLRASRGAVEVYADSNGEIMLHAT
ncbi:Arc family DNA-binding protein [Xinfangfangia sp. D13-10-4-6]|uniref:YlcI/YnfO family protein n=1 Tax=Pseudogemmobacter hezensis TaxID=2737662 RepID=UPI001556D828|nr:YlcI/YnfO family protein [Pseudogemmobacter hezensis]NPD17606.1 Arc family DNA-binding protein [Pseudogemmobacter hezensis]